MAVPMPADRDPAIIDAAQRLRSARLPRPLQLLVQLALDHGLDKAAHPITHRGFNRIEPIIEKIHSCIGDRLRGIRLRSSWRGLLSDAQTPDDSRLITPETTPPSIPTNFRDVTIAASASQRSAPATTGARAS